MTDAAFKDGNLSKTQNGILTFNEIPDLELYLKAYAIPPISLGTINIPTPTEYSFSVPSNTVLFDPLIITFLVDENLETHAKLMEWLFKSRGFEDKYAIDATLFVLSNKGNVIREIHFNGVYPFQLGEVQFDLNADDELLSSATFKITSYRYGELYGSE